MLPINFISSDVMVYMLNAFVLNGSSICHGHLVCSCSSL